MQIDAANRAQDEHHEEKEEQRYRRKEADLACQRPGLQLLRHFHPDLKAGDQVLVIPHQLPSIAGLLLARRRKRAVREIDLLEICAHLELEVSDRRDILSKAVPPVVQAL